MTMNIRVQYDAQTRTFRLIDDEFRTLLEGDAFYDLALPFEFEDVDVTDVISPSSVSVAHA
jgi:hypothetical protein